MTHSDSQIEGPKMLSRSLKCYPSLSLIPPPPQGASARFGVVWNVMRFFVPARSGLENLRNFRTLQFWQPRARFAFLSNVWAKYRLSVHFKPKKVSGLLENVQPRPRGAFPWLWRWGARLNRARISVPNESGGSGERLSGEGNSKMEQRGPSSKHTACVLAVRMPWQ